MTEDLVPSTPLQLELTTHSYDSDDNDLEGSSSPSSSSPSSRTNVMLPAFVSDDFYFNDVKRHYKSCMKRQLSLSYLMTVGAKALVLVDAVDKSSSQLAQHSDPTTMEDDVNSPSGESCGAAATVVSNGFEVNLSQMAALQSGMLDEAVERDCMVREEKVKLFLARLAKSDFKIVFTKRGRNSHERRVEATYEISSKKNTIKLVWRDSIFHQRKTFHIDNLKSVDVLSITSSPRAPVRKDVAGGGLTVRELQIIYAEVAASTKGGAINGSNSLPGDSSFGRCPNPYIRLTSSTRSLDIRFDTFDDTFSLLHVALRYMDKSKNQSIQ